ncbi:hypothetical protein ABI59_06825 [Acidobacteria bacterium Mor1]|nr:hypothetical protein ABI59_06825 [Acidobacteria bacterium Mor1]
MRRTISPLLSVLTLGCLALALGNRPSADVGDHDVAPEGASPPLALGERVTMPDTPTAQFDFWLGSWEVQNRHLRDGQWHDSGTARATIRSVAGGRAVLEQWNGTVGGQPLIGFSLRAWDGEAWPTWLYWHGGTLGAWGQMIGTREGRTMVLTPPGGESPRYTFSDAYGDSARWSESRKGEDGSWTTSWIMDFRRDEPPVALDAASAEVRELGNSAQFLPNREQVQRLVGSFSTSGEIRPAGKAPRTVTVRTTATSMTDGAGLLLFVDYEKHHSATAVAFDGRTKQWGAIRADSDRAGMTRPAVRWSEDGLELGLDGGWVERWSCANESCRWSREQTSG